MNNGVKKSVDKNDNLSSIITNNNSETLLTDNFGIVFTNATAKWTDIQIDNSLENINLTVKPGQLATIIGPVGSGKVHVFPYCLNHIVLLH